MTAAFFDSKTHKKEEADAVLCRTDDIVEYFMFSKIFPFHLIFMDIEFLFLFSVEAHDPLSSWICINLGVSCSLKHSGQSQ